MMDPNKTLLPVRIARLIYGFVNESLSPNENQELDDRINLSNPGDVATKQTGSFGAILLKRTNMICLKGQTS